MQSELPSTLVDYLRQSRVALAVASTTDDNPLVYVNAAFTALTGFEPDDVVGRNCRMLQHHAPNIEPRARLREFIANERQPSVRTLIVNFRKDGRPFVNLLYMSRLRAMNGGTPYLFASQFDVSRSHGDLLTAYNAALEATLGRLVPIAEEAGIVVEGTLLTIANSAATIAQAKMMLAGLDLGTHA